MMSNDQNNHLWGVLLAAGAAAAAGVWLMTQNDQPEETPVDLDEAERRAIDHLASLDLANVEAFNAALARVNTLRAMRKIREQQNTLAPMTPEIEAALLDIYRYRSDDSREGVQALLAATAQYVGATQQAAQDDLSRTNAIGVNHSVSPPPTYQRANRVRCGYCDGAGWYVCFACQGTGKNRLMPPPKFTGDPRFDALIAFNHNDTCQSCKGSPQITCNHCKGIGYQQS